MVIFGGLEFIVGGILVHKHYKHKNEKKRIEAETHQRRNHTFPGATTPKPQATPLYHHHNASQQHHHPGPVPQHAQCHKYVYQASSRPQAQPQQQQQQQGQAHPHYNPQPITHTQSFNIPRRPVLPPRPPQSYQAPPPQIIQPLQRADSCATISRMPIANGYRPTAMQTATPAPHNPSSLSPIMQSPYSTGGFSVSSPALHQPGGLSPTSPHVGRHTAVDDNWETYSTPGYAPSVSTALGERYDDDEPPPPYRP
ncbi:unnamed protein product [Periconia digitata]|uniref:Uncharacterized protein n=1 Tax=Periconia digitata TaxID=1303443 RepID=A0A9W4UUF1_9PLEO|nr:unnamed protein product [Periconia digitata]